MNKFELQVLVFSLTFIWCNSLSAQRQSHDTTGRKSFLQKVLTDMVINRDTPRYKPTEKNERVAYELKRENIYPSNDALELIYILNPWLDNTQDVPQNMQIRMPTFPMLTPAVRKKMNDEYDIGKNPDSYATTQFDTLTRVFSNNLPEFIDKYNTYIKAGNDPGDKLFLLKLRQFNSRALPELRARADNMCKSKVEYLTGNMRALLEIMGENDINVPRITYMENLIKDFVQTNKLEIKGLGYVKPQTSLNQYVSYDPNATGTKEMIQPMTTFFTATPIFTISMAM